MWQDLHVCIYEGPSVYFSNGLTVLYWKLLGQNWRWERLTVLQLWFPIVIQETDSKVHMNGSLLYDLRCRHSGIMLLYNVSQSISQSVSQLVSQSINQSRTRFLSLFLSVPGIRLVENQSRISILSPLKLSIILHWMRLL